MNGFIKTLGTLIGKELKVGNHLSYHDKYVVVPAETAYTAGSVKCPRKIFLIYYHQFYQHSKPSSKLLCNDPF